MNDRIEEVVKARFDMEGDGGYRFGVPAVHGALGVMPIFLDQPGALEYLTYDQALAAGTVEVRELGEAGSVPELLLVNKGKTAVLVMDGEQLVGARQNRVLNTTVLVAAASEVVIPVSCVEQGRWHFEGGAGMRGSDVVLYQGTRARKSADVSEALRSRGRYESDQQGIWRSVGERMSVNGVSSPTMAMHEHYSRRRDELGDFAEALSLDALRKGATGVLVGALFTLGGAVAGLDAFDQAGTFASQWPKLLSSYAIEAVRLREAGEVDAGRAGEFVHQVADAETMLFEPPGLGHDVRLTSRAVTGSALVYREDVVHAYAFALSGADAGRNASAGAEMQGYKARRGRSTNKGNVEL